MPNWGDVLRETFALQSLKQREAADLQAQKQLEAREASDTIRRKYLSQLHAKRNRNIIAYYSGFLSKPAIFSQLDLRAP